MMRAKEALLAICSEHNDDHEISDCIVEFWMDGDIGINAACWIAARCGIDWEIVVSTRQRRIGRLS